MEIDKFLHQETNDDIEQKIEKIFSLFLYNHFAMQQCIDRNLFGFKNKYTEHYIYNTL